MVQCLGEQIFVFGFVDRNAVNGHVGDGCLGAVRILLGLLGWSKEEQGVAGTEGDATVFETHGTVFREIVAQDVFPELVGTDVEGLTVDFRDTLFGAYPDIAKPVFCHRAYGVGGKSVGGIEELAIQLFRFLIVGASHYAFGSSKP